ncbi:MAG: MgtC/SapB family protein [Clostridia bacterium]|nr:MgtC/SapB family protein [Clostridia bacterium]
MINFIVSYFHNSDWLFQIELLLRIFIAGLCGCIVGYERKNRGKGAGMRTHTIVAIASCLLMIISQYGFSDFISRYSSMGLDTRVDPSRIGAQIVSGIGFLGAGMIFIQKRAVTGLTTAAGIWATAGIGMSIGTGMYFISIATTIIIVVVQIILHKNLKFLQTPTEIEFIFTIANEENSLSFVTDVLCEYDITITAIEFKKKTEDSLDVYITAVVNHEVDKVALAEKLYKNNSILSVKI